MAVNASLQGMVIALYVALFVIHGVRARRWQWLLGALFMWLGVGWICTQFLPGITGVPIDWIIPTRLGEIAAQFGLYWPLGGSLFQPYLPIFLSSLFFVVNDWKWHPKLKIWFANPKLNSYLIFLAVSGLLQHLAYLVLLFVAQLGYPHGLSIPATMSLLQLYALQPVAWIGVQWTIMGLFWAWRRIFVRGRVVWFAKSHLQMGFLTAFMMIMAWSQRDIWFFMARVFMRLMHWQG